MRLLLKDLTLRGLPVRQTLVLLPNCRHFFVWYNEIGFNINKYGEKQGAGRVREKARPGLGPEKQEMDETGYGNGTVYGPKSRQKAVPGSEEKEIADRIENIFFESQKSWLQVWQSGNK